MKKLSRDELLKEIANAIEDKMISLGYDSDVLTSTDSEFQVQVKSEYFKARIGGYLLSYPAGSM